MSFRITLLPLFVILNVVALLALRRGVAALVGPERRRQAARWVSLAVLLLSLPMVLFFLPGADVLLRHVPSPLLRIFFYPSAAWLATIISFFLIGAVAAVMWSAAKGGRFLIARSKASATDSRYGLESPAFEPTASPGLSRRNVLIGAPGLLIPAIYGVAAYGVLSAMDEIDISPEHTIPIPHLPQSLEGLTIVQISDLHVGPYVREPELQHVVSLTNRLRPDLVVITGDVLDRSLSSLPDAVNGLKGMNASLGLFAVLGNHDYYADRSSSGRYSGAVQITKGLDSIGIKTLRNQVVHLGDGNDRLALLGLDWLTSRDRRFFSYKPEETRWQLSRMLQETEPGTPRILLTHPDTFQDVPLAEIGLTLSGHTHGGGQVIVGWVDGVPIGLATMRFKYLSGLYQENGSSLYVNRGIGYLGIPVRINCPPEISRFKLVRSPASA